MQSIKDYLKENGYGGFLKEMKTPNYQRIINKINEKYNTNYTLQSIIPLNQIKEVL